MPILFHNETNKSISNNAVGGFSTLLSNLWLSPLLHRMVNLHFPHACPGNPVGSGIGVSGGRACLPSGKIGVALILKFGWTIPVTVTGVGDRSGVREGVQVGVGVSVGVGICVG